MRNISQSDGTLKSVLSILYPENSLNSFRQWISEKRVLIDGCEAISLNQPVKKGQAVAFIEKKPKFEKELEIVYEDSHLVVVNKPAGLLSVARDEGLSRSVHQLLKKRYYPHKVFVIHRLDEKTSGLILFARSQKAFEILKEDLKARHVKRIYIGIVEGILQGDGSWENYLYEDKNYFVHVSPNSNRGQKAVTHFTAGPTFNNKTFAFFQLETGKKNQIRIQASFAGHPIVGDEKYNGQKYLRLLLHAYQLDFVHPITKKPLSFICRPESCFLKILHLPKLPPLPIVRQKR